MDANSRFLRNAKDFHILLRNNEISGSARDLFVTQSDFDYMETIFPMSGATTPASIAIRIFIYSTDTSRSLEFDWVTYLEKRVWKI